ncbi:MAG: hypothetical protein LBD46_08865 [Endomicrobium sp.]|nr:hypothetical protein [Endomicrobium sp.]
MKKILLMLTVLSAALIVMSCSKEEDKKTAQTIILADNVEVNSLSLQSGQIVNLKAVLKDANGNPVSSYTTSWSSDAGSFSSNTSSVTVFTTRGSISGNAFYLSADCNGIKKTIGVTVSGISMEWTYSGGNSITSPGNKNITVTVTGVPSNTPIYWRVSQLGVRITESTLSGEPATITVPANLSGSFYVYAKVNNYEERSVIPFNIN